MTHRTPAYWPTRIMLVVGIVSTAAVVLLAGTVLAEPCFGCGGSAVLGLPSNVAQAAIATGLAVVGLVWMLRIFLGARDESRAPRYRDR